MPALPNVPNVCKLVFAGVNGANNFALVMHVAWTGTSPSVASLNSFANSLFGLWGANLAALYPPATILNTVTLTDLTTSTGNQGISTTAPKAGTSGGAVEPANAAILVNYPSSFRYRGGHPRTYFPCPAAGVITNENTWASTVQTDVGNFMTALGTDLNTLTNGGTTLAGQCAVSYYHALALRATPVVMPIANGVFTVVAKIASQRRRIGRK